MIFRRERYAICQVENELHSTGKRRRLSELSEGNGRERLGTRGRGQLDCGHQPPMDGVAAEKREHFEETWTYRFSRDGDPNRVDERSGFHTPRVSCRSQRLLDRCHLERRQLRERRVERVKVPGHILAQMFVDRALIVLDLVGKEVPAL